MSQRPSPSRARLVAAAGLLGSAAAVVAITGVGPVPSVFQLSGSHGSPSGVSPLVTEGSSLSSDDSTEDTILDDDTSTTIDDDTDADADAADRDARAERHADTNPQSHPLS